MEENKTPLFSNDTLIVFGPEKKPKKRMSGYMKAAITAVAVIMFWLVSTTFSYLAAYLIARVSLIFGSILIVYFIKIGRIEDGGVGLGTNKHFFHYDFFKDHMEINSSSGLKTLTYEDITSVYEDEDGFWLTSVRNERFKVSKSGFAGDDLQNFIEIRNRKMPVSL